MNDNIKQIRTAANKYAVTMVLYGKQYTPERYANFIKARANFMKILDEVCDKISQPAALALDARWVSAKDRLPDPFCEVLIHPRPTDYCCEGSVNTQGEWSYGEYEHHFGHNSIKCNVTHWMPTPAPPVAIAAKQGAQSAECLARVKVE